MAQNSLFRGWQFWGCFSSPQGPSPTLPWTLRFILPNPKIAPLEIQAWWWDSHSSLPAPSSLKTKKTHKKIASYKVYKILTYTWEPSQGNEDLKSPRWDAIWSYHSLNFEWGLSFLRHWRGPRNTHLWLLKVEGKGEGEGIQHENWRQWWGEEQQSSTLSTCFMIWSQALPAV